MKYLPYLIFRLAKNGRAWKRLAITVGLAGFMLAASPAWDAIHTDPRIALSPRRGQRVTDSKGVLYLQLPEYGNAAPTAPTDLPANLVNAVIAREDQRFMKHHGVDVLGILRALVADVRALKIKQGGSTVTMQLVELTYNHPERSFIEKLQAKVFEVIMAVRIERAARAETKDKKKGKKLILARYLDLVPFGGNSTGIQKAAASTFGKPVKKLNLGESAYLAGLIRAPYANNVYRNEDNARAARDAVIKNMLKCGMITRQQAQDASFYAKKKPAPPKRKGDGFTWQAVEREIRTLQTEGRVSSALLAMEDLEIQMTVDPVLQDAIRTLLQNQLARIEAMPGFHADPGKPVNGAALVLNNRTCEVIACVGGRDFDLSEVNLALGTGGRGRPLSSAFKVVDYASYLESSGHAIDFRLSNSPLSAAEAPGYTGLLSPREPMAEGTYPLWMGLKASSNRMACRVSLLAGNYHWSRLAREWGFIEGTARKDLSLFLGNCDVTPIRAAAAYSCIARGGSYVAPRFINRILVDGKEVYTATTTPRPVLSPRTCDEITKALREVLRTGTASSFGGAELARRYPVAGKTGTSENCTDAWFCGYSSAVTVVVWIGFPHGAKTIVANGSGGSLAFPVWKGIIEALGERRYIFGPLPELTAHQLASGRPGPTTTQAPRSRPASPQGSRYVPLLPHVAGNR